MGHWLPRRHQRQHSEPFVVGVDALDETVGLDPAGDVSPVVAVDLGGVDVSLGGLERDQALFRCLDAPASAGLLLPRQQIAGKATCPMDDLPFACVVPPARAGRSRSRRVVPGRSGPKEGERFRPESVIGLGRYQSSVGPESVIGLERKTQCRHVGVGPLYDRHRRRVTRRERRAKSDPRVPFFALTEVGTPYREAPGASHSSNLSCIAHEEMRAPDRQAVSRMQCMTATPGLPASRRARTGRSKKSVALRSGGGGCGLGDDEETANRGTRSRRSRAR